MPLFHRRPHPAEFAEPVGTMLCSEAGCHNQTGTTCNYRDRRGHGCDAAFCAEHRATVGGVAYCRRHGGLVTALGPNVEPGALPEIDNRGPSLVNWVAAELSAGIVATLRRVASPSETVQVDTTVAVIYDNNRRRRWERSWKLLESTGVTLKVCVQVAEDDDDALIDARVGSVVVARGVPPWVARRRAGQNVSEQVDADQRGLYRQFFFDHINDEVARQRSPATAPGGRM
jgi:hypothetical protein